MKKISIYGREIIERTDSRKWRYKTVKQFEVDYDGLAFKTSDAGKDDPKLRKPFALLLETRSKKDLRSFIERLGRTDSEKRLKETLELIDERESERR